MKYYVVLNMGQKYTCAASANINYFANCFRQLLLLINAKILSFLSQK